MSRRAGRYFFRNAKSLVAVRMSSVSAGLATPRARGR